ncbi:MAG: hypothetical protein QF380_06765, partial [Candidatus Marinimicrobia bacterium]|nr:hypothetical protein [Candidatus Neomarinimicrobiota bacterium]
YTTYEYWNAFPRSPMVMDLNFNGENIFVINNHYKCCGDEILDFGNEDDEEYRRYLANELLKEYIDLNLANEKVILVGDLNDVLTDDLENNVFQMILNDPDNYLFADLEIAQGNSENWSYPWWPSHIDHILITNELFDDFNNANSDIQTIKIDDYLYGGFDEYYENISDHRPVALKLNFATNSIFGEQQNWGLIDLDEINEASGIVASRKNGNVFWTHNDSDGENCVYAFNQNGENLGQYYLSNCTLRDWEDIAIGPSEIDGEFFIYVADIGDNYAQYNEKNIYRFIEPNVDSNQQPQIFTISEVETISFVYPDQPRDAETILVDPLTQDIYVVSKREEFVNLYRLPYPQSTIDVIIPDLTMSLDIYPEEDNEGELASWVVGGDISSDGLEILLKSYAHIFYFNRNSNQTIEYALSQPPLQVPYFIEPQGEAVAWHHQGFGYFTLSEETFGIDAHLYFYPRIVGCTDEIAVNYNPYADHEDGSCEYLGDINSDSLINVLDIVLVVDIILSNGYNELADLNNDNLVNVLDIVLMITIILE